MQKFEIVINLEHVAAQRKAWNEAARVFSERVDTAMKRLIHEAAAIRMSTTEVGKLSGFTSHQIKQRMKAMNLNPSTGKALLSKQAAAVLETNAEILGIKPHEIDLTSPLAYLPAGPALKAETSSVHELEDTAFPETLHRCSSLEIIQDGDGVRWYQCTECKDALTVAAVHAFARIAQADEAGL